MFNFQLVSSWSSSSHGDFDYRIPLINVHRHQDNLENIPLPPTPHPSENRGASRSVKMEKSPATVATVPTPPRVLQVKAEHREEVPEHEDMDIEDDTDEAPAQGLQMPVMATPPRPQVKAEPRREVPENEDVHIEEDSEEAPAQDLQVPVMATLPRSHVKEERREEVPQENVLEYEEAVIPPQEPVAPVEPRLVSIKEEMDDDCFIVGEEPAPASTIELRNARMERMEMANQIKIADERSRTLDMREILHAKLMENARREAAMDAEEAALAGMQVAVVPADPVLEAAMALAAAFDRMAAQAAVPPPVAPAPVMDPVAAPGPIRRRQSGASGGQAVLNGIRRNSNGEPRKKQQTKAEKAAQLREQREEEEKKRKESAAARNRRYSKSYMCM